MSVVHRGEAARADVPLNAQGLLGRAEQSLNEDQLYAIVPNWSMAPVDNAYQAMRGVSNVRRAGLTLAGNGALAGLWSRALGHIGIRLGSARSCKKRLERIPKPVRDIAWKAQVRLRGRFRRLLSNK
jgi:transposase